MEEVFKHSVCRICGAGCDLLVTVRGNDVVSIIGDKHNPAYHGLTCSKGRESGRLLTAPSRLLSSQVRQDDGSFRPIDHALATAQIAKKLQDVIARHGPESVAAYMGTYCYHIPAALMSAKGFLQSIGSPMLYTVGPIDMPGKATSGALHGKWLAGALPIRDWDVMLLIGSNPAASMVMFHVANPARMLKKSLDRGMQLVVIDPRRTDAAKKAAIHLQCRPGEDSAILAGIVRCLLREGLIDHDFVAAEAEGIEALAQAVEAFTPEHVAERAGISAEDLVAAARLLGRAARGAVMVGTGPNMAGHCNLVEYLGRSIHTLRGWWLRAGQERVNPGALVERFPSIAAAFGPQPVKLGLQLRTRGLSETVGGLPTAALSDEILTPGKGQIKALFVVGGNPMMAWPDQLKTFEALKSLDLLVCLDPRFSETARLAHYVIAPKLGLEVETNSAGTEMNAIFVEGNECQLPYAQVSPPVVQPPAGADVWEEWESFYAIAQHMKLQLVISPFSVLDPKRQAELATPMDMEHKPSTTDVWRMVLKGSPISYDEVRQEPQGRGFSRRTIVQPKPDGWQGRLQLAAPMMMEELAEVATESRWKTDAKYPFRLTSLRMKGAHNSSWREHWRNLQTNPVFMNPADMALHGIEDGDVVDIRSARATIQGIAQGLADIRAGCVSMSHGYGTNPDEPDDPRSQGGSTARLIANDIDFDRLSGIPRMSGIPVCITVAQKAGSKASSMLKVSVSGFP